MGIRLKTTSICLIVSFGAFNAGVCFAQDMSKGTDKNDQGIALEQALKNYEAFKQKEQDEIAQKINVNLNQVTQDWITQSKKDKEGLMGTRLDQNWEKQALYFPISPSHYEYNLRGYKYSVIKNDVSRSESITSPYNATVSIKEDLYVERYHSQGISDATPYFYTVTTIYDLNFGYRQNKLELINTDSKIIAIVNDAPLEIRKRILQ